jgi:septal ring factor EnvC (AmiA/AmiB activator)
MEIPTVDWLNPVEGTESLIKSNLEVADTVMDSFCRCMDMSIWQDTTASIAESWQSAVESWTGFFTVGLAGGSPAANTDEIESLQAQNEAFSEQIVAFKKEVAQLKRSNTLQKKAIEQQKAREVEQRKTVTVKEKEIAELKKELNKLAAAVAPKRTAK